MATTTAPHRRPPSTKELIKLMEFVQWQLFKIHKMADTLISLANEAERSEDADTV